MWWLDTGFLCNIYCYTNKNRNPSSPVALTIITVQLSRKKLQLETVSAERWETMFGFWSEFLGRHWMRQNRGLRMETGISAHRDIVLWLAALSTPLGSVRLSGCQVEDTFKSPWQPELVVMSSSATYVSSFPLSALSAVTKMQRLQWSLLHQHSKKSRMRACNNNTSFCLNKNKPVVESGVLSMQDERNRKRLSFCSGQQHKRRCYQWKSCYRDCAFPAAHHTQHCYLWSTL